MTGILEVNGYPLADITADSLATIPWLAFDDVTHVLHGVPTYDDPDPSDTITITATNSSGTKTQSFTIDVTSDPGMVGHWPLDESTGATIVADMSGNGLDGALIGDDGWRPTDGQVDGAIALDDVRIYSRPITQPEIKNLAGIYY